MNAANRKTKLTKYEVTLKREIEYTAVVEVEARSVEEAEQMAENIVDEMKPTRWREGDVTSAYTKAKVMR